jgi:AraC family transcriptional regulator of adaptative response/methylated-DNA-[protein]-cysteine methyltransferase
MVTRAATMVKGGMVSIATLIKVNEPPQISERSISSPISRAGCEGLDAAGATGDAGVLTCVPPGSAGRMIRNGRTRWRESDLIVRWRPIPATPQAGTKLISCHGYRFGARAGAAAASRSDDLRPGATGARPCFRRPVLLGRTLDADLLPPGVPRPSGPLRDVTFYATAAAAERAGFRPCLRCRPETAPGSPAWMGTATTVARGMRMIEAGFLDRGSVAGLADALGVGPRHLLRLFMRHAGASPSEVAATRRVQKAKRLIDETDMMLAEIAFAAGFGSVRRFNDAFRASYQRSPSSFRRVA